MTQLPYTTIIPQRLALTLFYSYSNWTPKNLTTSTTRQFLTWAFESSKNTILSFLLKPSEHSVRVSQNSFLTSFFSLPGLYSLTNAHFPLLISTIIQWLSPFLTSFTPFQFFFLFSLKFSTILKVYSSFTLFFASRTILLTSLLILLYSPKSSSPLVLFHIKKQSLFLPTSILVSSLHHSFPFSSSFP